MSGRDVRLTTSPRNRFGAERLSVGRELPFHLSSGEQLKFILPEPEAFELSQRQAVRIEMDGKLKFFSIIEEETLAELQTINQTNERLVAQTDQWEAHKQYGEAVKKYLEVIAMVDSAMAIFRLNRESRPASENEKIVLDALSREQQVAGDELKAIGRLARDRVEFAALLLTSDAEPLIKAGLAMIGEGGVVKAEPLVEAAETVCRNRFLSPVVRAAALRLLPGQSVLDKQEEAHVINMDRMKRQRLGI